MLKKQTLDVAVLPNVNNASQWDARIVPFLKQKYVAALSACTLVMD